MVTCPIRVVKGVRLGFHLNITIPHVDVAQSASARQHSLSLLAQLRYESLPRDVGISMEILPKTGLMH